MPAYIDWARNFSSDLQEMLCNIGEVVEFIDGEYLIRSGDCDTHLFLLISGEVLVHTAPDLTKLVAGEVLGEMAFLDNRLRTASASAIGEVKARRIERQVFFQALSDQPRDITTFLDALSAVQKSRLDSRDKPQEVSPRTFVIELAQVALAHRAVIHPYLAAMASGELPDIRWALADFARHYHGYSAHFPRYLTCLISRLECAKHRTALLENLAEETGHYSDEDIHRLTSIGIKQEWIVGIPHPFLFQRFRNALGMHDESCVNEHIEVTCWREMFLNVLSFGSPAEAVGALGLGTENIVQQVYIPFVAAIEAVGTISEKDAAFFPLHTVVDDCHQAVLNNIATELAETPASRMALARGMHKALALRANFWTWLHQRAQNPGRCINV